MVLASLKRLGRVDEMQSILRNENFVCTMLKTKSICKIKAISKAGNIYYKFPRLSEAYEKIFGYKPTGDALHNAIIDVIVCLRIFCKLGVVGDFDVYETNAEITKLIDSISERKLK